QSSERVRLLAGDAAGHRQKVAERDVGLARIGQGQRFRQPIFVADFGVQRQLLAVGKFAGFAIGQEQAEGQAGVGLGTGIYVEVLVAITVFVPFSDDVAVTNNEQGRSPFRRSVVFRGGG